jgi:hypothetical protein
MPNSAMLARMPRLIRNTLVSVRDLIAAAGPFVLLALLLLAGAYVLLDPAPPKRVVLATGPEQSNYAEFGQRYAAELKRYGVERDGLQSSHLEQTPAVVALLAGEIDALVMTAAPESLMVQMLLQTPGVTLFEFAQADAYARRLPFLSTVVLPRGVVDLARNLPAHDLPLVATTTTLVAREGTHPALQQLFVQAAHTIHGGTGWLARAGQFPSPQNTELPLAKEAERYYRNGPPLLQRYLPFWLANLIDRMWVVLVSILAMLIPLGRVVPPLYEFRIRSRVFRWYRQLREIEDALRTKSASSAKLLDDVNKLEAKAQHITVPLSYADQLYSLRSHIQLVRERLSAANEAQP